MSRLLRGAAVVILLVVVAFFVQMVRATTAPSTMRTFDEQLDDVPYLAERSWESRARGGGGSPRRAWTITSELVLSRQALDDPGPPAQALSSIWFDASTWSVEGHRSSLELGGGRPDAGVTAWWLGAVRQTAEVAGDVRCRLTHLELHCTASGDEAQVRAALSQVDREALLAWLAHRPDDQTRSFELRLGSSTLTSPEQLAGR